MESHLVPEHSLQSLPLHVLLHDLYLAAADTLHAEEVTVLAAELCILLLAFVPVVVTLDSLELVILVA